MKYREQILKIAPEDADILLLKSSNITTCRGITVSFPAGIEEVYFVDLCPNANWGHPCMYVGFMANGQVITVKDNMPWGTEIPSEFLFREPPEFKWLPFLRANYPKLISMGRELWYVPYEGEIDLSYGKKKIISPPDGEVYLLDLADGPIDDRIHYSTPHHPCLFFIFDADGKCSIVETTHPMWPSLYTHCLQLPLEAPEAT